MASRRNVISQTDIAFWREVYRDQLKTLTAKFAGRRRMATLEREAAESADRSVTILRARRATWGNS
jgi:hypothetical protein